MATLEQVKATVDKVDEDLGFVTEDLAAISDELEPVAGVESTPYTIQQGYNMIGYTGPNGVDIVDAFTLATGSPDALNQLQIIKDQAGIFYVPGFGGPLTTLVNGRGYFLKNEGPAFTVNWGSVNTLENR